MDIIKGDSCFYIGKDEKDNYARIIYDREGDKLTVTHTVVDEGHEGQGIAGKLVNKVKEFALEEGLKLDATCSYAKKKFEEDEELKDVYVGK